MPSSPNIYVDVPDGYRPAEMAMQSRDDKLMDAAGGSSTHITMGGFTTSKEEGEALTEENVFRLEEEEEMKMKRRG